MYKGIIISSICIIMISITTSTTTNNNHNTTTHTNNDTNGLAADVGASGISRANSIDPYLH